MMSAQKGSLTLAEQAIAEYKVIRDTLRVPFPEDLRDSGGQFPKERQWTLPNLDKKALQDKPKRDDQFQNQAGQSSANPTQSMMQSQVTQTSEGGSSKQTGRK